MPLKSLYQQAFQDVDILCFFKYVRQTFNNALLFGLIGVGGQNTFTSSIKQNKNK
jgi:hypothetical protein